MKTKLFIILSVIFIVTALFGWRYYYLPNVVMAKRTPVGQKAKINSPSSGKNSEVKSGPVINMRTQPKVVAKPNMLKNGSFNEKLKNWQLWHSAKSLSNTVKIINITGAKFKNALRIENPMKNLVGIQQRVRVVSNVVYKLSGIARSVATTNSKIIFGGRIGFFLPPQKEKQIVWMSEYNHWWKKDLIFTNQVSGIATLYVHMGYGNVASTGEFTNISLEKLN